MQGRPRDPNTGYRVRLHITHGYRYAATTKYFFNDKTNSSVRRYVYWGTVTLNLVFEPNVYFRTTPLEERSKLIFPPEWDISAAFDAKEITSKNEDSGLNNGAMPPETNDKRKGGIFTNLLYGASWLLMEIAKKLDVVTDLEKVFQDKETVNEILTLAIFPIISKFNYDHVDHWQNYTWAPANFKLTSSYITRLTQAITDNHRMSFLKLRVARQTSGTVLACDSTTRSAWGNCLADIRWGSNKDNPTLRNTVEVVVYSLTNHEPIFYRTFAGNESDIRTIKVILADLRALGCTNLLVIFDRGYESSDNLEDMLEEGLPFLMCAKVAQSPVYKHLGDIVWDDDGLPLNMNFYEKERVYCAQFDHEITINSRNDPNVYTLKINLFLDIDVRMETLRRIKEKIKEEKSL